MHGPGFIHFFRFFDRFGSLHSQAGSPHRTLYSDAPAIHSPSMAPSSVASSRSRRANEIRSRHFRNVRRSHTPASNRSRQTQLSRSPSLATPPQVLERVPTSSPAFADRHTPQPPNIGRPEEADFDDDSLHEIVAAVNVRDRGTVGCAYYVAREGRLFCMEDIKLGGIDVVGSCKSSTAYAFYSLLIFLE